MQRALLKAISLMPQGAIQRMAGDPIEARGATLDPMMQLLWVAGKKQPDVTTLQPAAARATLDKVAPTLQARVPKSVTTHDETIPGQASEIPIRVYTPVSSNGRLPVTLFFHFGGCVIGSREICHGFCGVIAERAQCAVVNVEYRLAPEHPFPAPVEDSLAAYTWTLEHAGERGWDRSRVAVAGDSAGGLFSAVIAQEAKRRGWQPPVCQVLIYPWLVPYSGLPSYDDFAEAYPLTSDIMTWFGNHYFRSDEDRSHPWSAPLNETDLTGLAPAIVVTAGFDPLRDEGEQYAERLKAAGVPVTYRCYEHLTHSFTMFGGVVPAAQRACIEIAEDLGQALTRYDSDPPERAE